MELFQYSPINEYSLENLEKGQIFFNVVNKVNDPYEGIFDFEVEPELETEFLKLVYGNQCDEKILAEFSFEELMTNVIYDNVNWFLGYAGISCYSETNTSPVMWGNYADSQKGICVSYNSEIGVFKEAQKVSYSNDVLKLHFNSQDKISNEYIKQHLEPSLYLKYQEWAYEKEWRIISSEFHIRRYPDTAIKAIFFGLRTSNDDINRVLKATIKNKSIKYYKAVLVRNEYRIEYTEI